MLKFIPFIIFSLFSQNYSAKNGVVDLSKWDKKSIVELSGEWEFYWNKAYFGNNLNDSSILPNYEHVPSNWTDYKSDIGEKVSKEGFATYRLIIVLPSDSDHFSLKIPYQGTSYNLYLNNRLFASEGTFSTNKEHSQNNYRHRVVSFNNKSDTLELLFHVSSYHFKTGGLWYPIQFGTKEKISAYQKAKFGEDLFLIGVFVIIGLLYFGMYLMPHNSKEVLYFSLFCFGMAVRQFSTNENYLFDLFPGMSWEWQVKFLYGSLYLLVPSFSVYFYLLFKDVTKKWIINYITYPSLFLLCLVFLTPAYVYSETLEIQFFIIIVGFFTLVYFLRIAIKQNIDGSLLSLIGVFFILTGAVNDILHGSEIIFTGFYAGIGIFFFMLIQTLILSLRSSNLITEVNSLLFQENFQRMEVNKLLKNEQINKLNIEHLAEKLERLNEELEEKVQTRTMNLEIAKKDAEKASEAKTEFLSTITHELRTPLNAIIGYTSLLRTNDYLKEADKTKLDMIYESGMHLLELINSILETTKINAGKVVLIKEEVHLGNVLHMVINMFRIRCEQKSIELHLKMDSTTPEFIHSDEKKIKQILINLIENAFKYTNTGSITLQSKFTNGQLILDVIDTGIGIKKNDIKRILEPFQQVDTKSNVGGTGLGLSIVNQFIQLFSGTLEILSEFGKGSTFKVSLPIKQMDLVQNKTTVNIEDPLNFYILIKSSELQNILTNYLRSIGIVVNIINSTDELANIKENLNNFLIYDRDDFTVQKTEMKTLFLSSEVSKLPEIEQLLALDKPLNYNLLIEKIELLAGVKISSEKKEEKVFNIEEFYFENETSFNRFSMEDITILSESLDIGDYSEIIVIAEKLAQKDRGVKSVCLMIEKMADDLDSSGLESIFTKLKDIN